MIDVEIIKTVITAISIALSADKNCDNALMIDDAEVTESISPMLFVTHSVIDHRIDCMIKGAKLTNKAMIIKTPAPERRIPTLFCNAPYASAMDDPINGMKELNPNRAALFATLSAAPDNAPLSPITAVNILIIKVIPYLKPLLTISMNPPSLTRDEMLAQTDSDRNTDNNGVNNVTDNREIT